MSKLKPCPFCGSEATVWEQQGSYIVECDNDYCGCAYGYNFNFTYDQVVSMWNKRSMKND